MNKQTCKKCGKTFEVTDIWHYEQGYVGAHKRFMVFEWTKEKLAAIYYV